MQIRLRCARTCAGARTLLKQVLALLESSWVVAYYFCEFLAYMRGSINNNIIINIRLHGIGFGGGGGGVPFPSLKE